jgi:hypothetical protein
MKMLQDDPRVEACWSTGGTLQFKKVNSDVVMRVTSVYMSNDDILK